MTEPVEQGPAAYRFRVGDIILTTVNEGYNPVPLKEGFIRNASLAEMQTALGEARLPTEVLNITFSPLVIQSGGETTLVDTGFADNGPPTTGFLRRNLAAVGIRPEEVSRVVITHFHGDHINGLRGKDGEPAYPNAEVVVPAPEWDFWTDEARRAEAPDAMKANFDNVARVFDPFRDSIRHYRWDEEVAAGVTALEMKGHTPGHTGLMIASGGERFVFIADVVNHPALFVRNPGWSPAFDINAEQAIATRRRVLDMIADEGLPYAGYHIPFPAIGYIEKDGDRYRHLPIQWMAAV